MKKIAIVTNRLDTRGNATNGIRVGRALERLGYRVDVVEHDALRAGLPAIAAADLVLAFGTLLYPRNVEQADIIARSKRPRAPFALWYFDAANPDFAHSRRKFEALLAVAPSLDWLFTTDHSYPWENVVPKYKHLLQGVDLSDYKTIPPASGRPSVDVIFTGGFHGAFSDRRKLLDAIAARFSLITYGSNSPNYVTGRQFIEAYQDARVALVPAPPAGVPNYWSNRIYLAAGTGTPCVVGWAPGLEAHYAGGSEVVYFRSSAEMLRAIAELLKSPASRARIGAAGRARTLREHTYEARARELLASIGGPSI